MHSKNFFKTFWGASLFDNSNIMWSIFYYEICVVPGQPDGGAVPNCMEKDPSQSHPVTKVKYTHSFGWCLVSCIRLSKEKALL